MKRDDLPERWKTKVIEWVRASSSDSRDRLGAEHFPCSHSLNLTLDDGSSAVFHHAFLIEAPEWNEVGVFTEHCGYHIFPFYGTVAVQIDSN